MQNEVSFKFHLAQAPHIDVIHPEFNMLLMIWWTVIYWHYCSLFGNYDGGRLTREVVMDCCVGLIGLNCGLMARLARMSRTIIVGWSISFLGILLDFGLVWLTTATSSIFCSIRKATQSVCWFLLKLLASYRCFIYLPSSVGILTLISKADFMNFPSKGQYYSDVVLVLQPASAQLRSQVLQFSDPGLNFYF